MSSSTLAPPGPGSFLLDESGKRVSSSTIFVDGCDHGDGDRTEGRSALEEAIVLQEGMVVQGEAAGEDAAGAGSAGEAARRA